MKSRLVVAAAALCSAPFLVAFGGSAPGAAATCDGEPVTLAATQNGETVEGTAGPDVIDARGYSRVWVEALGGDDVVCSGPKARVRGGDGNDRLLSSHSGELDGGSGDDVFRGGPGREVIFTGDGDDTARGRGGSDHIIDSSGVNDLHGGAGNDIFEARNRRPGVIDVPAGTVSGRGTTTIAGFESFLGKNRVSNRFIGTDAPEEYYGGMADHVSTGGGDDLIDMFGTGRSDEDEMVVRAGRGDDTVVVMYGGRVYGGRGDDLLVPRTCRRDYSPGGARALRTGPAARAPRYRAVFRGGRGNDRLRPCTRPKSGLNRFARIHFNGDDGTDTVTFSRVRWGMRADLGDRRVRLGRGTLTWRRVTRLVGSRHADVLRGTGRPDSLVGGPGRDRLHGAGGADLLRGGSGRDRGYGGAGRDTCRSVETRFSCERR